MAKRNALATLISLSFLWAIAPRPGELRAAEPDETIAPESGIAIKVTREPIFPQRLKAEGYTEGIAIFSIVVDQFGELRDVLLLEASHPAFGEAITAVIDDWDFGVPIVDGEPTSIVQRLKVSFESGAGLTYATGAELGPSGLFRELSQRQSEYRIAEVDEIDSIPVPTHIEKPAFPKELLKGEDAQEAVFEFYIDENGNVRMPTLRDNNRSQRIDEQLLLIAQEALLQWKFEPPRRRGKPVVVRVAQPIRFTQSAAITAKENPGP